MIYAVIIILVVVIVLIWILSRFTTDKTKEQTEETGESEIKEVPTDCCGAHEVCEADSFLSSNDNIEYYNDEELDRFKGTTSEDYTEEAIEEFRDVLYTLKEREVAGWAKSIQLRKIELPEVIREEILMIVEERRNA